MILSSVSVNFPQAIIDTLKPETATPVRELLINAGLDVSDWAYDKFGKPLANPNTNSYKNSFWSFEDDKKAIALCIWHKEIFPDGERIVFRANMQTLTQGFADELAEPKLDGRRKQSLSARLKKARRFGWTVFNANRDRTHLKIIILGDNVADATEADHPAKRLLDPSPWHVEHFDAMTGEFCLCRGLPPPRTELTEDEIADQIMAKSVNEIITSPDLSKTEKEALVKQRVGQGLFRSRLIAKWKHCALTACRNVDLLIASHIIPWSKCSTTVQRLEASNGLLLAPHIDKLFDAGFISFDDRFEIMISPTLSLADRNALNISPGQRLKGATPELIPSLSWHRANVYRPIL